MNDGKDFLGQGSEEKEEPQKEAAIGAVSGWIARNPRRVLWFIILTLIPYLLLCWGMTFTTLGALFTGGGCG